jgi:VanZ family protein
MLEPRLHPAPHGPAASSGAGGGIVRRAVWAAAIAGLIFFASSRPTVASPGFTTVDDKFAHFAVYGLLATLICRIGRGWRAAVWSLFAVSAFGASDEWHQSFVPGRFPGVDDWIADTLGAGLAVVSYTAWTAYRQLLETPVFRWRRRIETH